MPPSGFRRYDYSGRPLSLLPARQPLGLNPPGDHRVSSSQSNHARSASLCRSRQCAINGVRSANSTPASSVNAAEALGSKLSALEGAQGSAARTRMLPDGRIRYYGAEKAARTPGPTRGAASALEWDPATGRVRMWWESYDQAGNVTRVHPKMINGQQVNAPHYPPTGKELGQ